MISSANQKKLILSFPPHLLVVMLLPCRDGAPGREDEEGRQAPGHLPNARWSGQRYFLPNTILMVDMVMQIRVAIQIVNYEALSGWGSRKVFLDIIFKIQENLIIMISSTIEMLFLVYSNTFLQKIYFSHVIFLIWFMVLFSWLISVLCSLILMENFVIFSNACSCLELMLCN